MYSLCPGCVQNGQNESYVKYKNNGYVLLHPIRKYPYPVPRRYPIPTYYGANNIFFGIYIHAQSRISVYIRDSDWWEARLVGTTNSGFIPSNHVKDTTDNNNPESSPKPESLPEPIQLLIEPTLSDQPPPRPEKPAPGKDEPLDKVVII